MTGDAAGIIPDRTEFLVTASAIEARRLEAHRVDVRPRRSEAPRLVLDRLDQLRPVVLAAQTLLYPEQLYEQNRGPDLSDDAAGNPVPLTQGNSDALVFLLPHLLIVVADQTAEHRLLGLSDGAFDGNRRHRLAQRHVDRGLRELHIEAALVELGHQRAL